MIFAKFPAIKLIKYLIVTVLLSVVSYVGYLGYLEIRYIRSEIKQASEKIQEVEQSQLNFSQNLTEELYSDHLEVLQKQNLEFIKSNLESEIETLKTSDKTSEVSKVNDIIKSYNEFLGKFDRNTKLKLDTSKANGASTEWGNMLLAKDFEELSKQIADSSKVLDDDYNKYLASLPKEQTQPSIGGYSYVTVKIDRGTFYAHVIKLPFSKHKTKTVSASDSDCENNCPTKSLAEYVKENGAYAGMNGAYFCPPDYSSCNGKVNSTDYAFYDSNDGKWYNKHALDWNKTGLVVWNGNTPKFYKESTDYSTGDGATAGISNYPTLLDDGKYVAKDDDMTSYQKTGRGAKGVIGRDTENIYLAIIMNATVPDAGYVSKQLGMNDALNLDGGGSSAMYINGRYIMGPGRSLPSAIVIY